MLVLLPLVLLLLLVLRLWRVLLRVLLLVLLRVLLRVLLLCRGVHGCGDQKFFRVLLLLVVVLLVLLRVLLRVLRVQPTLSWQWPWVMGSKIASILVLVGLVVVFRQSGLHLLGVRRDPSRISSTWNAEEKPSGVPSKQMRMARSDAGRCDRTAAAVRLACRDRCGRTEAAIRLACRDRSCRSSRLTRNWLHSEPPEPHSGSLRNWDWRHPGSL